MKTIGTLFSGGGLVDIGAMQAGLKPVFAVEYDKDIAQVYRDNIGQHVIIDSIVNVDPKELPRVDLLWASPPCQGFSVARSKALPERIDKDLGLEVIRFLEELLPDYFILENVPPYKKSSVLAEIISALAKLGYFYDYSVLNAADFGVPQSRRRLILRASRVGMLPNLPQKEKHRGWYSAIADLVDDLPDGKFANWQIKYLEKEYGSSFVADMQDHHGQGLTIREGVEPIYTIPANERHFGPKAFLARVDGMECDGYVNDLLIDAEMVSPPITSQRPAASLASPQRRSLDSVSYGETESSPSITETSSQGKMKVFLASGQCRTHDAIAYEDHESSPTVTSSKSAIDFKALVRYQERGESKIIEQNEPMATLTAKHTAAEYRLIRTQNPRGAGILVDGDRVSPTISENQASLKSLNGNGRVVSLTPRCMARFQTIPDWYKIPAKKTLAARIIGNGVPCSMVEKLIRNLMQL